MSWVDRLRPKIKLVSPTGTIFEVYWRGDPRSIAKKLGIFDLARIRGVVVQDLEVGGTTYSLTLLFSGADHDLEADKFFVAAKERGTWTVTHPVKGLLTLQLVSLTEVINPIESGNVTQISTEWIEPISEQAVKSLTQLAAEVETQILEVNEVEGLQYVDVMEQSEKITYGYGDAALVVTREYLANFTSSLCKLSRLVRSVEERTSSIYRGIIDLLTVPVLDYASLSSQVQSLIQLPVLVSNDVSARLDVYGEFIDEGIRQIDKFLLVTSDDDTVRNTAGTHELFLSAAMAAVANIAVTGFLKTRVEAVETAETISNRLVEVSDKLEKFEGLFSGEDVGYYAQRDTLPSMWLLIAQAINYVLRSSFDLAIEKRFTLANWRTPIEIVVSEYGSLGDEDVNLVDFVAYNNIVNRELLLMPPGKELVVYI